MLCYHLYQCLVIIFQCPPKVCRNGKLGRLCKLGKHNGLKQRWSVRGYRVIYKHNKQSKHSSTFCEIRSDSCMEGCRANLHEDAAAARAVIHHCAVMWLPLAARRIRSELMATVQFIKSHLLGNVTVTGARVGSDGEQGKTKLIWARGVCGNRVSYVFWDKRSWEYETHRPFVHYNRAANGAANTAMCVLSISPELNI